MSLCEGLWLARPPGRACTELEHRPVQSILPTTGSKTRVQITTSAPRDPHNNSTTPLLPVNPIRSFTSGRSMASCAILTGSMLTNPSRLYGCFTLHRGLFDRLVGVGGFVAIRGTLKVLNAELVLDVTAIYAQEAIEAIQLLQDIAPLPVR